MQEELTTLGLASQVEEEFSDDVQSGFITHSDPDGGGAVHKRASVLLYVSKGIDMKEVPNLVGSTQDMASRALSDAGLAIGAITDAYSEDVAQGQVISQSVAAGTSLAHDSTVDVVLSKGREPLTVPSLAGQSSSAAKSSIEALGLVAAPSEAYSDTVAEGQVISQQTREARPCTAATPSPTPCPRAPRRSPCPTSSDSSARMRAPSSKTPDSPSRKS